jgi:hypothetical protein
MSSDSELETFLRRFKPRAPAPLPRPRRSPSRTWSYFAAAAASAALILLLAWRLILSPQFSPRAPEAAHGARPTLGALNAALRAGNLDSVLDEMGKHTLPDPSRPGGALEALARDGALPGRPKGGSK